MAGGMSSMTSMVRQRSTVISNWSIMLRGVDNRSRHVVRIGMDGLSNDLGHRLSDLHSGRFPTDRRRESVMMVGMVIDDTLVAIGVQQTVLTMNLISVAGFMLALDVSGVAVMHGVSELVVGGGVLLDTLHDGMMNRKSMDGGHVMHRSNVMLSRVQLDALIRGCMSVLGKGTNGDGRQKGCQCDELLGIRVFFIS